MQPRGGAVRAGPPYLVRPGRHAREPRHSLTSPSRTGDGEAYLNFVSSMRVRPIWLLIVTLMAGGCGTGGLTVVPRPPGERIQLIVRGDDFGTTHASNMALQEAFADGIMTSASLLVPGPWFRETAALVRDHPEWRVGVHLTITSEFNRLRWAPVLPAPEVATLVAPDGAMYGGGYFADDPGLTNAHRAHWASAPPDPLEVERELRAQIRLAQEQGIRVDYVDCHMGMACRELLPVVQRIAEELCLPIPEQGLLGERDVNLEDAAYTEGEGKDALRAMLESLTPGLWRYIGHPAHDTPELRAVDSEWGPRLAAQRATTHRVWRDPDIRKVIARRGIELVSVADVWDYEACAPSAELARSKYR